MAYVKKILAPDEELIGIARLHWIYVMKGIAWFIVLAGSGYLLSSAINYGVVMMANATNANALPLLLMKLSNGAMYFLMFGGALLFFFFTLKVLVTEVGLSSRRILLKEGLIFVRVKQVDLEEIRGENLDLGWFGRLLGYGYIFLDCRFIGDVRLPAIEKPERFTRALHDRRAKSQDSLSVVLGKGNGAPLDIQLPQDVKSQQQPEIPQPAAPQPTPEIQPGQTPVPEVNPPQTPNPEVPAMPVPHSPPPPQNPPQQPEQPQTPPAQPTPAPPPSEPPLQPPSSGEDIPGRAQAATPPQSATQGAASSSAPAAMAPLDPKIVEQVVQQVMPQMAQQVAQELVNKGMVEKPSAHNDNAEPDLIHSFDEAALDQEPPKPGRDPVQHAIH